jgi:hypothetical protein
MDDGELLKVPRCCFDRPSFAHLKKVDVALISFHSVRVRYEKGADIHEAFLALACALLLLECPAKALRRSDWLGAQLKTCLSVGGGHVRSASALGIPENYLG